MNPRITIDKQQGNLELGSDKINLFTLRIHTKKTAPYKKTQALVNTNEIFEYRKKKCNGSRCSTVCEAEIGISAVTLRGTMLSKCLSMIYFSKPAKTREMACGKTREETHSLHLSSLNYLIAAKSSHIVWNCYPLLYWPPYPGMNAH